MNDDIVLNDQNLDDFEKKVNSEVLTQDEIKKKVQDGKEDRMIVNDKSAEDEIHLGELGIYKRANLDDVKDVFEKLPGTIFQLKSCMFRVSFINTGQYRFTAELVNPPI